MLERDVELDGVDGATYRSRQIHLLADPEGGGPPLWRIPASEQPTVEMLRYTTRTQDGWEARDVRLEIRDGFPVKFIEVRPSGAASGGT